ncbi:MAG: TrkH family potassium uptake protein [Lachnospiraceae bacterium]|nr:TrkH family potassium uptake protein [Lachnospiraceae bacterium]
MNGSIIRYILGSIIKIEGILMLLPCIVSVIYKEQVGFYYLGVALFCIALGFLITFKKPTNTVFYLKEGCVSTALSWVLLSIFGALPFFISGEIPSFTDAMFETISGFTTTGASILPNVEALSYTALFWRSFTHWVGGMGVLVFLLAIIPMTGGSHMNLMKAESPGPSVGKLVPKVRTTARILYLIYLGMTVLQIILLLIGKMPLFDAITLSFGTAGTGGFGIKVDSIAGYSPYLQWVITIFMILFGINFNAYYLLLFGQVKKALCMEEVRAYLGIILASGFLIFLNILDTASSAFEALTDAFFQVGSIITTTGYATTDFNLWPGFSQSILVILMFIGACAGSTGGGIKVSRIVIGFKAMIKELHSYIHPKSVRNIKFEGKPVEHDLVKATNLYFVTFLFIFGLSTLLISVDGFDLVTNFTAVAATFNNIGPGLAVVGPMGSFGGFSDFSKFILMFDMLAGRLELFPMLLLFHPTIWKDLFTQRSKRKKQ